MLERQSRALIGRLFPEVVKFCKAIDVPAPFLTNEFSFISARLGGEEIFITIIFGDDRKLSFVGPTPITLLACIVA